MSYTEFHKGKIKIVARGDEAIKKYIKDNNLEERLELDIDEETGKIEDLEDTEPYNGDRFDHEYHMITYKHYLPKTYDRNPNAEHLLIKYINHEHRDLDDGDIDIHNRVSKDEFEFAISFYNGGTYELEIYEDIINKFDLDEPFEENKISIRISKDYDWKQMMYESDVSRIHRGEHFTMPDNYTAKWETIEVTNEELFDYIKKGYAIKINC
jgi:hypothetical protein